MRLFEHEAKKICEAAGFAIPSGLRVSRGTDIAPVKGKRWLKAQVLSGNRFGAGLVVPVGPGEDPNPRAGEMFQKIDALHQVDNGLFLEDEIACDQAWYVSLTWDRATRMPICHVRSGGGTGIEERSRDGFDGSRVFAESFDWSFCGIPQEGIDSFRAHLVKLFDLFVSEELTLFEINPLAWVDKPSAMLGAGLHLAEPSQTLRDLKSRAYHRFGIWYALDAKATTDGRADEAHKRPLRSQTGLMATPWEENIRKVLESVGTRGTFGMPQELAGDILPLLSGGGASLVAMDALLEVGGAPAAYVEYSGNPAREAVRALASAAMTKLGLKGIWVAGGTANFTDIADTVAGILEAYESAGLHVPMVIRRDGPNAERAKIESESWAASHGVNLVFDRSDVSFLESARKIVQLAYIN